MTVEIREVTLKARVVGGPGQAAAEMTEPPEPAELKREILAECDERIRVALRRLAER